jgi:hypothetical protein
MILTDQILEQIVDTIMADPTKPVLLPDHCYDKRTDKAIVYVDGLPIGLHRHLYNTLIHPLAWDQRMVEQSGHRRNVNPYLYGVNLTRGVSGRTHCGKGHAYAGNEMPDNSGHWRCRTCYLEWRASRSNGRPSLTAINRAKTHCPRDHEYTEENTIINADGKRRCRTCVNARKRLAASAKRKEQDQ